MRRIEDSGVDNMDGEAFSFPLPDNSLELTGRENNIALNFCEDIFNLRLDLKIWTRVEYEGKLTLVRIFRSRRRLVYPIKNSFQL